MANWLSKILLISDLPMSALSNIGQVAAALVELRGLHPPFEVHLSCIDICGLRRIGVADAWHFNLDIQIASVDIRLAEVFLDGSELLPNHPRNQSALLFGTEAQILSDCVQPLFDQLGKFNINLDASNLITYTSQLRSVGRVDVNIPLTSSSGVSKGGSLPFFWTLRRARSCPQFRDYSINQED